ncbi:DUF4345 domain-containing protein [Spirosoma sp.]|uniref:DUF4345 domain-containing protein n=1 Tax=Spirosoma sp. TaxID=1899569 RepID=UPI002602BA9D|nr:DUF4345 domain-containing protein [Spirosoma sp.]MCX6216924.1 DUF4345 domain-containing protein [Spirosoma sp.]
MQTQLVIKRTAQGFILVSALALLSVSLMAFCDPQSVMDLVQVQLNNTDPFSSIRGVYGGVGLTLCITLLYLMVQDVEKGLLFLSLLWGLYALSRVMTVLVEGPLGAFGRQWLFIETLLFIIALTLVWVSKQVRVLPIKLLP